MNPFFSIIIPAFNRASPLPKAIDSVLAQTFSYWELIIVDDGSTDKTSELVHGYSEPKVRYHFQENAGRSAARNSGINLARAEYICFLDSDDYFLESHLESFCQAISAAENKVALFINGMITERENTRKAIYFQKEKLGSLLFFFDNVVHSQQVCVHRSILEKEKFNPSLAIGEDLELWLRIGDQWPVVVNELHTVVVVDHEDRSVNKFKNNPGLGQMASYKIIFKNNKTQKEKIKAGKKRELLSNTMTSIGLHYLLNSQKVRGIWWLLKAIFKKPRHPQAKFRLYAVFSQIPLLQMFFKKENVIKSIS